MTGRLCILTNIPTPYRIAFFEALSRSLKRSRGSLDVLYCADSEPGRQWRLPREDVQGDVLGGIHPRFRGATFHLNPSVRSRILGSDPDWVLIAGGWMLPSVVAATLGNLGGAPRIFWSEGHSSAVRNASGPIAWARKSTFRRFDGFAVPNQRSADFAQSHCRTRRPTIFLPNTVDERSFGPDRTDSNQVRTKYGIPLDARVVAVVASLEPRKRVLETLEAFLSQSHAGGTHTHLVFIGSGPLEPEMKRRAASCSRVSILGHLDAAQVGAVLAASDAFLLASRYDPNPLSTIEAALSGCVLMTTRSVGNTDELTIPSGGLEISDSDPDDLDRSLRRAFEAISQMPAHTIARLGSQARRFALARYSRAAVADSLVEQLTEIWPPGSRTRPRSFSNRRRQEQGPWTV